MPRPRILFITPRVPVPDLTGGENWIYSLAAQLAEKNDLYLFSFLEPSFEAYQAAGSLLLEKLFKKTSCRKKDGSRPPDFLPVSPGTFFSPQAAAQISSLIKDEKIDLVHIFFQDLIFYSEEIKGLPLVYTEIDSSWLSPFSSYMKENAGAAGLRNVRETFKYRKYAARFLKNFSAVTCLSREDMPDIRKYLKTGNCVYTPNALELEKYRFSGTRGREKDSICFIGNYLHYPNADAALALVRDIFPAVRKEVSGVRLVLAGPFLPEALKKKAGKGVETAGYVKDHLEFFRKYSLMAAPVRYGKGIKTKVLEAFASGLPVAGYPETFCGLDAGPSGERVLKGRGPKALAGRIISALRGECDLEGMAARSRRLVEGHDIKKVGEDVSELYGKLCA